MKHAALLAAVATLSLAACSQEAAVSPDDPFEGGEPTAAASGTADADGDAPAPPTAFPDGAWEMVSSGEGDGLFFGAREGEPGMVHMFCPADGGLLVNVNAFRPVGSEERMTLGSGEIVATLVADPGGDASRGGVSGEGDVPADLETILAGAQGVSVNYGSQDVGPLPPVPAETARNFVAGCND